MPRITGINCTRHRPVFPPSSACGTLLKIKGMLSSMTADLMSMNSDSSGSETISTPIPIIPFRRPATIRLQTTGSNDACLLRIKGVDQHGAFSLRGSQLSLRERFAQAELSSIDILTASTIRMRMVAAANLVEVGALATDTARATC